MRINVLNKPRFLFCNHYIPFSFQYRQYISVITIHFTIYHGMDILLFLLETNTVNKNQNINLVYLNIFEKTAYLSLVFSIVEDKFKSCNTFKKFVSLFIIVAAYRSAIRLLINAISSLVKSYFLYN